MNWTLIIHSLYLSLLLNVFSKLKEPPFGGEAINEAIKEVFGEIMGSNCTINKETIMISKVYDKPSTVRRRCSGRLACEYFHPVLELQHVIIYKGVVFLNNPDTESLKILSTAQRGLGSRPPFLPACLASYQGRSDWVLGPRVQVFNSSLHSSVPAPPRVCTNSWDSLYFHFPWESRNAFHSLNDNVMAVMASVALQHLTRAACSLPPTRTLLLFNKDPVSSATVNLIFRLLHPIFGGDVRPAAAVLTGGPHCVGSMAWGNGVKPMYRDALVELRRLLFLLIKAVLRRTPQWRNPLQRPKKKESKPTPRRPRAVIITRRFSLPDTNSYRKLASSSETALAEALQQRGFDTEVCCDFKAIRSTEDFLSHFGDVDVCIGVHGAGMANCVLAREGVILVEFQNGHSFGFDSFMKIAHMAAGYYVFLDIRYLPVHRGTGAGSLLSQTMVENIATLAHRLHNEKTYRRVGFDGNISTQYVTKLDLHNLKMASNQRALRGHPHAKTRGGSGSSGKVSVSVSAKSMSQTIPVNRTIRVVPAPRYRLTAESILGPQMEHIQTFCKALPYYQFRLSTMTVNDHKHECDRNIVRRQPKGILANSLLKEFCVYSGGNADDLFPRAW